LLQRLQLHGRACAQAAHTAGQHPVTGLQAAGHGDPGGAILRALAAQRDRAVLHAHDAEDYPFLRELPKMA
jgi:hypothetical protein